MRHGARQRVPAASIERAAALGGRRGLNTPPPSPSSACRTSTLCRPRAGRLGGAADARSQLRCARGARRRDAPVAPPAVLAAVGRLFREEGDGCAARIAGGTFSGRRTRAPSGAPARRACRGCSCRRGPTAPATRCTSSSCRRRRSWRRRRRGEVAGVTAVALVVARGRAGGAAAPGQRGAGIGRPSCARPPARRVFARAARRAVDARRRARARRSPPTAARRTRRSPPCRRAGAACRAARRRAPRAPRRVPRPRARERERGEFAADVGTRRMVHRHLFYAFAAAAFEVVAAGAPSRCRSRRRRRRRRRPPSSSPPASRSTRRRPSSSSRTACSTAGCTPPASLLRARARGRITQRLAF